MLRRGSTGHTHTECDVQRNLILSYPNDASDWWAIIRMGNVKDITDGLMTPKYPNHHHASFHLSGPLLDGRPHNFLQHRNFSLFFSFLPIRVIKLFRPVVL